MLNAPGNGPAGTINHLGVEVFSTDDVDHAEARLTATGLRPEPEPEGLCCYARQHKTWVSGTDGAAWECYTVLDHAETP